MTLFGNCPLHPNHMHSKGFHYNTIMNQLVTIKPITQFLCVVRLDLVGFIVLLFNVSVMLFRT